MQLISTAELRALRQTAAEFDAFIGSFPDLYFRLDPDGRIVDYRARLDDLYAPPERFLGKAMEEVLPEPAGALLRDALHEARRSGSATIVYALPMSRGEEHYQAHYVRTGGGDVAVFIRNISDTLRMRAQREHAVSLLRATLEATDEGLLVLDRDGGLVDWNQRFLEQWRIPGLAERSVVDYVLDRLIEPDVLRQRIQALHARPEAQDRGLLHLKDGRVIEGSSRPQVQGDEIVGRVWSFRDVTERARSAAERERLLTEAQEAVRLRDEFLSIASHELRTPLTSMLLGIHMLQRACRGEGAAALPPRLHTALETAARQGRQLTRFVDDMLSVARIRTGRLEVRPAGMDLAELVREVADGLSVSIAQAGCALSLRAPRALPGRGDRERLGQVVTNLLTNAIRYGAGGPIELALEAGPGRARLSVADRGVGIAPEDQRRIFERFERGSPSTHYGGLGLGLYIVRQIVEAHGGEVRVESAPGAGATFTVELPWDRA